MKYLLSVTVLVVGILSLASCSEDDFLTRPPMDEMTDQTFWTSEDNVRTFAWGFYEHFFWGYGESHSWGKFFSGETLNDDFAPSNPTDFVENVPTSGGGWAFDWVRKANLFIDRVPQAPMGEEAVNHWTGVGRFFRAMEYHELVKRFGDVQWYDQVLEEDDMDALYKKRDSRITVMDNVLADFQYAVENVRLSDGTAGLTVNKDVVLAYMSRVFLWHGTWLKYHTNKQDKATEYLQAARDAANQLIESGRYSLAGDYRSLFNSMDLAGNPEIILYRKYEEGVLTHVVNTYSNNEPQTGASKDAIEAYLMDNGMPVYQDGTYNDQTIDAVMSNRDPRLTETFVQELRLQGRDGNYTTSGYAQHKFLNEDIADLPIGNSNLNPTDAPVMRYGEVLLNYAEAAAELGSLTQSDLNKSINVLRSRPGIDMPDLQVSGDAAMVNGQTIDDPQRDPDVSPILWEIRRERRVELMMEGFRYGDLRRWKKLRYTDTVENPDINRGAWINLADYPQDVADNVVIENGASEGYIVPAYEQQSQRTFPGEYIYLYPLPLDQIQLYKDNGVNLEQNPGW